MNAIRRVLVPVDFSRSADGALDHAIWLRDQLDAQLEILHVWESPTFTAIDSLMMVEGPDQQRMKLVDYVRQQAEHATKELLATLETRGVHGVTARIVSGDPVEAIVEASKQADLVVMGTHGRGPVAHFLLGSVAERVVRRAHCPVMTVREKAA